MPSVRSARGAQNGIFCRVGYLLEFWLNARRSSAAQKSSAWSRKNDGDLRGRLLRQDLDGLRDVAVGGGAGDAVVAASASTRGAVPELAQRQHRLVPAGQLPAPCLRGVPAALGRQQPGQVAKQFRGDVEHGTIGDHVESLRAKMICGGTSSTGTPRPFPGTSGLSASNGAGSSTRSRMP
jgi:hypothetical protein